jgi:hypothetical protein
VSSSLEPMTKGERDELSKLVRLNFRVARGGIDQRKTELIADFEASLAKKWSLYDELWKDSVKVAKAAVKQTNKVIAERYAETGAPPEFAPELSMGWFSRGENESASRRGELRKVAVTRIEAKAIAAKQTLNEKEAAVLTKLARTALHSEEARAFLDEVPSLEALMPTISVEAIEAAAKLSGRRG